MGRDSRDEAIFALPRPRLTDVTITVNWKQDTIIPVEIVPGRYKYVGEINGNPAYEQQTPWNVGEDRVSHLHGRTSWVNSNKKKHF